MIYLQTIIPIPIHTVYSGHVTESDAKVFVAIFLILLGIFIISLLCGLYRQWQRRILIDWGDLIFPDENDFGVRPIFHGIMIFLISLWALIYSGMELAKHL